MTPTQICAVEEASDIGAIERAGEYRGLYHVLGGRLSPLDGVTPDDLTIAQLVDRAGRDGVREVILATNPSMEGEATALFVQRAALGGEPRDRRDAHRARTARRR